MSKNKSVKMANITSKHVGKDYSLGSVDCFTLIIDTLKEMDIAIPDIIYGDLTMDNYSDRFIKDPVGTKKIMVEWLKTFTIKLDKKDILPGDILVLEDKTVKIMFAGIYTGNSRVMSVSVENGVSIYKLEHFNILEVYRCQQQ